MLKIRKKIVCLPGCVRIAEKHIVLPRPLTWLRVGEGEKREEMEEEEGKRRKGRGRKGGKGRVYPRYKL